MEQHLVGAEDYQRFSFRDAKITDIGDLMQKKLASLPGDWWKGSVLDVGTDHGFFAFYAAEKGADFVLGLDRGREVKGVPTNLVRRNNDLAREVGIENIAFSEINLGKQWYDYGSFTNVLMFSMYHHVFNNCMDHQSIWYWLSRHVDGTLWWEGPMSPNDNVVKMNVSDKKNYVREEILGAAARYFSAKYLGPSAVHGREVWRFVPGKEDPQFYLGTVRKGAGGASKAFSHAGDRRIEEIHDILGFKPVPGSLNIQLELPWHWESHYFRAQVLDLESRKNGLNSAWRKRWCRFYPVKVQYAGKSTEGALMRFEGEQYSNSFVEMIAPDHIRSVLDIRDGDEVLVGSL